MEPNELPKIEEKPRMGGREVRYAELRLVTREANTGENDDPYYHIEGTPIVFDRETVLWPDSMTGLGYDIKEKMASTCMDGADISDVVLNVNHGDGNHGVARTRNKTLEFQIMEDGVHMSASLRKDNPRCAQFYKDVCDGLLDRMSFAFTISEESYDKETHTYTVRKINKVYDVSAVEFPAYDETSISATRSKDLEKFREELESRRALAERKEELGNILQGILARK